MQAPYLFPVTLMFFGIFCLLLACKTVPTVSTPSGEPETTEASESEEGVKSPGNLPVRTEEELAQEEAARRACIESCVESRQMEAVAIEMIEESCATGCMEDHPIMQVEMAAPPTLTPQ